MLITLLLTFRGSQTTNLLFISLFRLFRRRRRRDHHHLPSFSRFSRAFCNHLWHLAALNNDNDYHFLAERRRYWCGADNVTSVRRNYLRSLILFDIYELGSHLPTTTTANSTRKVRKEIKVPSWYSCLRFCANIEMMANITRSETRRSIIISCVTVYYSLLCYAPAMEMNEANGFYGAKTITLRNCGQNESLLLPYHFNYSFQFIYVCSVDSRIRSIAYVWLSVRKCTRTIVGCNSIK